MAAVSLSLWAFPCLCPPHCFSASLSPAPALSLHLADDDIDHSTRKLIVREQGAFGNPDELQEVMDISLLIEGEFKRTFKDVLSVITPAADNGDDLTIAHCDDVSLAAATFAHAHTSRCDATGSSTAPTPDSAAPSTTTTTTTTTPTMTTTTTATAAPAPSTATTTTTAPSDPSMLVRASRALKADQARKNVGRASSMSTVKVGGAPHALVLQFVDQLFAGNNEVVEGLQATARREGAAMAIAAPGETVRATGRDLNLCVWHLRQRPDAAALHLQSNSFMVGVTQPPIV